MKQQYIISPLLYLLQRNHDKKYCFHFTTTWTTSSISDFIVFLFLRSQRKKATIKKATTKIHFSATCNMTTFTTPWSRQKKFFFSLQQYVYLFNPSICRLHLYVHYTTLLCSILRSLVHDQEWKHSGFHPPPSSLSRGGNWIFELNKIRGKLNFFKIKGERKRGGKEEFLKFSVGVKLLEMKLQTENKISEWI